MTERVSIGEVLRFAKRLARHAKEQDLAGEYPFPIIHEAHVFRGRDFHAQVWPGEKPDDWPLLKPYNSKDHLLALAHDLIVGLRPDAAAVVSDTYQMRGKRPIQDVNDWEAAVELMDETRRELQESEFKGSMQDAWKAGQADKFGITEAMIAIVAIRTEHDLRFFHVGLYYEVKNGAIVWTDESTRGMEGVTMQGMFFEAVKQGFKRSDDLYEALEREAEMFDGEVPPPDQRQFIQDTSTFEQVGRRGGIVAVGTNSLHDAKAYGAHMDNEGFKTAHIDTNNVSRAERRRRQRRYDKR